MNQSAFLLKIKHLKTAIVALEDAVTDTRIAAARENLSVFVAKEAIRLEDYLGFGFYPTPNAPSTFEEVLTAFENSEDGGHPFPVYSGACDNTIYLTPHHNQCFRFWHDCLHIELGADVSHEGELAVAQAHYDAVVAEFWEGSIEAMLMYQDTFGQLDYFKETGGFVENQLEFAIAQIKPLL